MMTSRRMLASGLHHRALGPIAIAIGLQFGAVHAAQALEIDAGVDDLKLRWDNTVKYSAAWRVKNPSPVVAADANTDDGDRNFGKGLISNRIDLLSELDATYRNTGLRVSAAGWYDRVYNRSNDNPGFAGGAFPSNASVPYNQFTDATKKVHGRNTEFLDAFVFGKFDLGGVNTTVRLGKHTVIYGESLFFGSNGIANAQGPVDLVKLVTVPGSQFKEILRPVEQVSTVLQFSRNLTVGAYYQFRWHESRIPAAGSYFSPADFAGQGAELLYAGPLGVFGKGADIKPKDSGQGGLQVRWAPDNSDWEYGFYAARYHDKTPYFYFVPAGAPPFTPATAQFQQVYHQGTRTFGASATTSIGQLNLAFEGSIRTNASLVSDPQIVSPAFNNSDNPGYAVGKSAHLQASAIYVLTGTPLWDAGSFLGEIAWNRRLSVQRNAAALDPNTTRDAAALRFIFEPQYFQVAPGLDLGVPIGVGWNFKGRSSTIFLFNGGYANAGDMSIGLNATYKTVWQAGLNFTHYFGTANGLLTPANSAPQVLSFNQFYKDRDFVSLTVKRAF